jgi:adenylate cyclase
MDRVRARLAKLMRSEWTAATITALLMCSAIVGTRALGLLEPLELAVYDRYLATRPLPETADPRIAVVEYTERDIQEQKLFPLPDGTLAEVLSRVLAAGPRAIGVDFYRDVLVPPGSDELERVLTADPRVIMISRYGSDELIPVPPPAAIAGTDQVGFSDLSLDDDDTVRRAILYQDDEEYGTGFGLALRTALLWLAHENVQLGLDPERPDLLRLGPTTLPRFSSNDGGYAGADELGYQILMDYRGAPMPFDSVTMSEVLSGEVAPERLRDRIVFVGVTAETHVDIINTPFGSWPGVMVHAHVASQLIRAGLGELRPVHTLSELNEIFWVLLSAALGAALGVAGGSLWVFGLVLVGGVVGIGVVGGLELANGVWLPVAPAGLAWVGTAFTVAAYLAGRERVELGRLMQLFSRHLSRDVALTLWEQRDDFLDGGRPRPVRLSATILFADVKGSTQQGEKLDPMVFMQWINGFMDTMGQEVTRFGGFLDDYFGDGFKADFGVPIARESEDEIDADVATAVRCALAMEAALPRLNAIYRERGLPEAFMRVGIATGQVVAGSIGSSDRLKYTLVGDTVNLAARLEGLDDSSHDFSKKPCRILIAERTHTRLGGRIVTRSLGSVRVKGKQDEVRVHEVLGLAGESALQHSQNHSQREAST